MVWGFVTQKPKATVGTEAKFFYTRAKDPDDFPVAATEFIEARMPSGANGTNGRPTFAPLNGEGLSRLYMAGWADDNLLFSEHFRLLRQGIIAPYHNIVNAAGSGFSVGVELVAPTGSGVTGEAIPYISWWDDLHQRRSPLSAAGPTISATADAFKWTNLPTSHPSDRSPTHLEGWRAMNGQSPRLAWRRQLGVTEVTEEVATLALGEAFSDVVTKFPRCRYTIMWHDRQVLAGDDRYPDRVYFSLLNQPELYGGLYIRTRRGERVTALAVVRDNLIVFTPFSCYIVSGYTEDDLTMRILEPGIGCISHHAIAYVHGYAIIPAELGHYLFTGNSFHFLSRDYGRTYRAHHEAFRSAFEDSFAANDVHEGVYRFKAPRTGINQAAAWILDYDPVLQEVGGEFGAPDLTWDETASGEFHSYGTLSVPGGRREDLYSGGSDGIIRQENYLATPLVDDQTGYSCMWELPHLYIQEPGGNRHDGWMFETMWFHMQAEDTKWYLEAWFGDVGATLVWPDPQTNPTGLEFRASRLVEGIPVDIPVCESQFLDRTWEPVAHHFIEPRQSGRGVKLRFTTSADELSWFTSFSGWGCTYNVGTAERKEHTECRV